MGVRDGSPYIQGGTDDTYIGNVGDNFKTSSLLRGGNSPNLNADVELIGGKNRLMTDAIVTVEEIFGKDPFADTWFRIENAGVNTNTVRVQLSATTNDPSTPDRDAPAVDVTVTVTASEAGDEIALRDKIINELNANGNFSSSLKALKVKDNAIVFITSKFRGEFWERPIANSFQVTTTGSASVTIGFNNLVLRGKPTELARSPDDGRQGILGISGSVTTTPGAVGDLYIENAKNAGSANMLVNGSVTPVVFMIPISATKDIFVSEIRFYGNANGIKFGSFMSISTLTNGVIVEIKSDDQMITFPLIKSTDDFKHKFSLDGGRFELDVQAGRDDVLASFNAPAPFPLRKQGTFATDDYVKVTIQDNLTAASLQLLEFLAFGFEKEA